MKYLSVLILVAGLIFSVLFTNCGDPGISKENAPSIEGMIFIPGGSLMMGDQNGCADAKPEHKVTVAGFYIDPFEVTHAEYKEFIDATGHPAPFVDPEQYLWAKDYNWTNGTFPAGKENHPVVLVCWDDAAAYAKWRGKRLPTEAEWEKASKGTQDLTFPWGNDWDAEKCNSRETNRLASVVVTDFENDSSTDGVRNLAGNVWEWCADWYGKDYYRKSVSENPQGADRGATKVIRGGSWDTYGRERFQNSARESQFPSTKSYDIGFRCVKDLPKVESR